MVRLCRICGLGGWRTRGTTTRGTITVRVRTPTLSAEAAAMEYARRFEARKHAREPQRLPLRDGYAPLLLDGPLDPRHPLYDTASDLRRKRLLAEKRRRGLL